MLYNLGYVSTETDSLGAGGLTALLHQAVERNGRQGITGLLLHREDSYFQILEGDKADVLDVFGSIERDPRHQRINVLFEGEIDKREFPDWRMGFVELDGVDVDTLPGFSDFLHHAAPPRLLLEELSRPQRLMLLFRAMG